MTLSEIHNEESVAIASISFLRLNLYLKTPITSVNPSANVLNPPINPPVNPSANVEPLLKNQKEVLAFISINHKCEQLTERTRKNQDSNRVFLGVSMQDITYLTASESRRTDIGVFFRRKINKMRKNLDSIWSEDILCSCFDSIFHFQKTEVTK